MKIKVFSSMLSLVNNSKKIHTILLLYIYIYLGCAGSSLLLQFSLDAVREGYSVVAVHELLIAVASLAVEHQTIGCPGFRSCNMWAQ